MRELGRLLETAHPDPFTGGGGREAFEGRLRSTLATLPEEGMTAREFLSEVRPLVASLHDGHTHIREPRRSEERPKRGVAVELEAVEERLYVSGVFADAHRVALGGRLVAVQGTPWSSLLERSARFRGAENPYNNLVHLATMLADPLMAEDFFEARAPLTHLDVELELPNGSRKSVAFPIVGGTLGPALVPPTRWEPPAVSTAALGFGFAPGTRNVAVLRVDSMMRYREAFETWRSTGFDRPLGAHLEQVSTAASTEPLPALLDAKIARIPSATELFVSMFTAMRAAHTSVLIVDLRKNEGGNSLLAFVLPYFLAPWSRLVEARGGYQVPRLSQHYFDNYRSAKPVPGITLGGFDYSERDAWYRVRHDGLDDTERRRRERTLEQEAAGAPTFDRIFRNGAWSACWQGRLIVVTSARTYSAGFDLAAALRDLGATVVGVPSAQSGNGFIDALSHRLSRSGLEVGVSYKRNVRFPDEAAPALLRPERELTWADLTAMQLDPNASLRLALAEATHTAAY